MYVSAEGLANRRAAVRLANHRRWHDGPAAVCGRCAFTAEELATATPPPTGRKRPVRLTVEQQEQALEVARAHGTTVAAQWAGVEPATVLRLRQRVDGYERGRGRPTRAEMQATAVRDDCSCPRCRAARGVTWPRLTADQQAMVEANVGLVGFFLNRWKTPAGQWDDAYQDGLIGLMRAAQKYEPLKGFTFSTYAQHWIRAGLQKGERAFEGRTFRAAQDGRGEWHPTVSLDAELDGLDDRVTLGDAVLVDDTDPADEATTSVLLTQLEARAKSHRFDRIDRAIIRDLFDPRRLDVALTERDERLADRFGYSREMIRQRRRRLQSLLRSWSDEVAA